MGTNDKVKNKIMDALDGAAGVNLDEPSEGDLKRIFQAYVETRKELDAARAEIEQLRLTKDEHWEQSVLRFQVRENERLQAELDKLGKDKASNDADYLRLSGEFNVLHEENKKLKAELEEVKTNKCKHHHLSTDHLLGGKVAYCISCGARFTKQWVIEA